MQVCLSTSGNNESRLDPRNPTIIAICVSYSLHTQHGNIRIRAHAILTYTYKNIHLYIYIYTLDLMYNIDIYTYDKQLEQPVHRDLETYIHNIHMYVCMLILEFVERLHLKILHMHVDSCTNEETTKSCTDMPRYSPWR